MPYIAGISLLLGLLCLLVLGATFIYSQLLPDLLNPEVPLVDRIASGAVIGLYLCVVAFPLALMFS